MKQETEKLSQWAKIGRPWAAFAFHGKSYVVRTGSWAFGQGCLLRLGDWWAVDKGYTFGPRVQRVDRKAPRIMRLAMFIASGWSRDFMHTEAGAKFNEQILLELNEEELGMLAAGKLRLRLERA